MGPPGTWPILLCFFITKRPSAPGGRSFRVLCGDDAAPHKQRGPISSRRAADRRPCPHVLRRFRRGGLWPPAPTRAAPLFVWGATSSSQSPHRYVLTSFASLAPPLRAGLVRSTVRPFPTRLVSLVGSPWLAGISRSAPLLVLSPRDPLRWARVGPLICAPIIAPPGRGSCPAQPD